MEKIYIGYITSTHGIKGEIKIKSTFLYKDKAFIVGSNLIIANKSYIIKSYRVHKGYDMITLDNYNNINQVEFLLKQKVYKEKSELKLETNEVLDSDLISYKVLTDTKKWGIIKDIFYASTTNKILRVEINGQEVLIPFNYITNIDYDKKIINIKLIEGML